MVQVVRAAGWMWFTGRFERARVSLALGWYYMVDIYYTKVIFAKTASSNADVATKNIFQIRQYRSSLHFAVHEALKHGKDLPNRGRSES